MTAWFNKNIKKDELDKMDEEFTRNYGNVKVMSTEQYETETRKIIEEESLVVDEPSQVYDEEVNDVVDRDEGEEENDF